MKTSDIKRVIDAGLADIETTQRDVDALMEYIRNAETRKPARKMPLAVAIAMVLMLIGAVAFAAMSFLGVIEHLHSIEEKEQEMAISEWSFEHKMEVVDLLVSSGTVFNEEMLMQVYSDELSEEEKSTLIDDMLMERFQNDYWSVTTLGILFHEKGYPQYWTHEERVWYNDLIGLSLDELHDSRYVLPTENDMSEEEALEIAYQYFLDNYDLTPDDFDAQRQYTTFQEMLVENDKLRRFWEVHFYLVSDEYKGQKLLLNDVQILIWEDGSYFDDYGPYVRTWEDDLTELMYTTGTNFWTVEGLNNFQKNYKPLIEQKLSEDEWVSGTLKYLIAQDYGLPREGDLPIETARSIARETVLAIDGWTVELIEQYAVREAYQLSKPNVYLIAYTLMDVSMDTKEGSELHDRNAAGEIPFCIRVSIDASNGNVIEVHQMDKSGKASENVGI